MDVDTNETPRIPTPEELRQQTIDAIDRLGTEIADLRKEREDINARIKAKTEQQAQYRKLLPRAPRGSSAS